MLTPPRKGAEISGRVTIESTRIPSKALIAQAAHVTDGLFDNLTLHCTSQAAASLDDTASLRIETISSYSTGIVAKTLKTDSRCQVY